MAVEASREASRDNPAPRVPLHPPEPWLSANRFAAADGMVDPCAKHPHSPDIGRQAGSQTGQPPSSRVQFIGTCRAGWPAPSLLPRSVDATPFPSLPLPWTRSVKPQGRGGGAIKSDIPHTRNLVLNPPPSPPSPTTYLYLPPLAFRTITPPMFLNFDSGSPPAQTPATRAPVVLGVSISLYIVTIIFVSAQIVVKGKLGKLGTEDMLISVAAVRHLFCRTRIRNES